MRKRAKQIYGILLSMSMFLTLLSVPVRAAEPIETGAGYEQKQEQQQEQEQEQKQIQEQEQTQEQGEGQTQNPKHEHTEACYTLTENCVHEHTSECYAQTTETGTVSGNDVMETVEAQPTECAHVCSEESGCISRRLSCPFEKESSGELQEEALEGSSGINVENALKANELPIVKAPNNNGDVELNQDNITDYKNATTGFYILPSGNYSLGEDITLDNLWPVGKAGEPSSVFSLDLQGHKLSLRNNKIVLSSGQELIIKDTSQKDGKLIAGGGIEIYDSAKLKIYGGTIDSMITYAGNSAGLYLYGGTIKRGIGFYLFSTNNVSNAVLYANGGTVEGDLRMSYKELMIRTENSPASETTFTGNVQNCKIEGGKFTGDVRDSTIIGGIFEGSVNNCTIGESAQVTVRFSNGGNKISSQSILRGQKAQEPEDPVKDGYAFDGWYVSGNPNHKWDFSVGVTENLTLEAHWNKVYQVTLQTNGGTIAAGKEIKSYIGGTTATLPGAGDITREGYTFEGWYTDSSFSGSPVTEIISSDTGDKTFYAKWSANIYIVKLETNGGKIANGKDVTAYTCGIGAALPGVGDITRDGYTFEGWYTDSSFSGSPVTEINSSDTGDKTFYAKWSANTYTVKLETNEGKITDGKEVTGYTYGTGAALPGVGDIIREGYTFEGWYTDSSFSGSPVTEITGSDTGDKTFYAKWKKNTVPVIPVETEHNTSHNNTDYYNTGDTNESNNSGSAAPVIYPTLTFDTCGGSSIKEVRAFEGHTINLSGYLPIREDYEFDGWYADQITEDQATEDQTTEDQSTEDTGDDQKSTVDNVPMVNDSKPDDSTDLPSEDNSHSGGWIPVICTSAGALVIGSGLYLGFRRRKKIDKK